MKTLKLAFVALLALGLSAGTLSAQTNGGKAPAKKTTTTTTKTNAQGQHLKKDGTPDMRYKENKQAAKTGTQKTAPATQGTAKTKSTGSKGVKTGGTTTKKSGGTKTKAPAKQ